MASQPSLRIGDAEREAVSAELREHYAHGRLTHDEFSQRLDAVFTAKTQRDLQRITSDLPLSALLAAVAAWLLVYDVILVGVRWPLGGRIGLLIAVFAVIRGLLRRIFGVRRGACGKRRW